MYENCPAYFAAANTTKGFISYFEKIFDPGILSRLYVIKGGPGTGKSGMMRTIASASQEKGKCVERFYCSSDPKSLDAVLLPNDGIAMADGTSPHVLEPIYPGAVESIVYTGAFWNVKKLVAHKKEIIELIRSCKKHYDRAYAFLNAIGEISGEMARVSIQSILRSKMEAQVHRLSKKLFSKQNNGEQSIRVLSTFNLNGIDRVPGYLPEAEKIWVIRDHYYTGFEFLEMLAQAANTAHQCFIFSPSCLFPDKPDALYFPETRSAFIIESDVYSDALNGKEIHVLDMKRFIDREVLKNHTQKLRFGRKCVATLLEGATEAFTEASKAHGQLERYYIAAMDYTALDKYTRRIIQEILKRP